MGFPGGSAVENSPANAEHVGSIPGSGRSPGEGNGNPLQYSCLANPMDRGAWGATVHGVAKESDMTYQLNDNNNTTCNILGENYFLVFNTHYESGIFNHHKITLFLNRVLQGTDTQLNPMKREVGHPRDSDSSSSHPEVGGRGQASGRSSHPLGPWPAPWTEPLTRKKPVSCLSHLSKVLWPQSPDLSSHLAVPNPPVPQLKFSTQNSTAQLLSTSQPFQMPSLVRQAGEGSGGFLVFRMLLLGQGPKVRQCQKGVRCH